MNQRPDRHCIVGAGAAGLSMARAFQRAGIAYDQYERHSDVGGMWDIRNPYGVMYPSAHMISTRSATGFAEFPMPRDAPDYPHHTLVARYFQDYATQFQLRDRITFRTSVERIERRDGGWEVRLDDGRAVRYRGVVVANGHLSEPAIPEFLGTFDGQVLHSAHYDCPDLFRGKRVLVVGAGNSGCDIVIDAVHHARRALISMRRGYHIVPKYALFGLPTGDLGGGVALPEKVERRLAKLLLRLLVGNPARLGIPPPDHELFTRHAIVSSHFPFHVGHGDITVKPDVSALQGNQVLFTDGSAEEIDLILCATGYRATFPFLDCPQLCREEPQLGLNLLHPVHDDLFVVGLLESVDGGNWRLFAAQAELIATLVLRSGTDPGVIERLRRFAASRSVRNSVARPHYVRNRHYLRLVEEAARELAAP